MLHESLHFPVIVWKTNNIYKYKLWEIYNNFNTRTYVLNSNLRKIQVQYHTEALHGNIDKH